MEAGHLRRVLVDQAIVCACAWATFFALYTEGFEAEWYRLGEIMSFSGDAPFQHRILLALLARRIQILTDWQAPRSFRIARNW